MYKCGNCGSLLNGTETVCEGCGKRVVFPKKETPVEGGDVQSFENVKKPMPQGESAYTAGAFGELFSTLWVFIVGCLSLGLAFPAMICWKMRWKAERTYINGRKLVFTGKGINLFGKMLLWGLLSVITLGIFDAFFLPVSWRKWFDKNTHFEGCDDEDVSSFDGGVLGMFGINLLTSFLSCFGGVTLGWSVCLAMCVREKWLKKHQVIDGFNVAFDGKSVSLFGFSLLWSLLTSITFGIFSLWVVVKQENWFISNTKLVDENA